jgi:DNA-directed RNA polymerase specialized sigma24 family protein
MLNNVCFFCKSVMEVKDWKETVIAHWDMINLLSEKRFGKRVIAEEAALYVMDRLIADDGRRVRAFRGSSFPAFLASVAYRLLEDFSRKRFGRRRPPKWLANLGGNWLRLYTMLCLERLDVTEAVATVEQSLKWRGKGNPEEAAWLIKQEVVDCGSHQGLEIQEDEVELAGAAASLGAEQQERLESEEREEVFRLLFIALTSLDERIVENSLGRLGKVRIELSGEEKLLLKLCFQDAVSITVAGKMLGYNRHQIHGRLRRLLARIRSEFERAGIDREILDLLD